MKAYICYICVFAQFIDDNKSVVGVEEFFSPSTKSGSGWGILSILGRISPQ
jgi:hypothetical protein